MEYHIENILRLFAALIITGIIGWEREYASKPAGARTHAIVGVTAALYAMLGANASAELVDAGMVRTDPVRTIQAIATGVGFLGAGLIFRDGSRVKGLTTAASVWGSAAVGVATAWAQWHLALFGALAILAALRWPFKTPATAPKKGGGPTGG